MIPIEDLADITLAIEDTEEDEEDDKNDLCYLIYGDKLYLVIKVIK